MSTNRSASSIGGSVDGMGRSDPNEKANMTRQMTGGAYDQEEEARKKRTEDIWGQNLDFDLSLVSATLVSAEEELLLKGGPEEDGLEHNDAT